MENQDNIILEKLKGLRDLMEEKFKHHDEALDSISIKLDKQNSKVFLNSEEINKLKMWQNRLIGGWVVITIIIIPIILIIIKTIL